MWFTLIKSRPVKWEFYFIVTSWLGIRISVNIYRRYKNCEVFKQIPKIYIFGTHREIFQLLSGALFTLVWWVVFLLDVLGDWWWRHRRCSPIDQLIAYVIKLVCSLVLVHRGIVPAPNPNSQRVVLSASRSMTLKIFHQSPYQVRRESLETPLTIPRWTRLLIWVEIFFCEYQKYFLDLLENLTMCYD